MDQETLEYEYDMLAKECERLRAAQTEIETIAREALDRDDDLTKALGKIINRCGNRLARANEQTAPKEEPLTNAKLHMYD